MELLEKLQWRYATKRMNGEKITDTQLQNILDAIHLSPSSMGLQPYNVLVISNKEILQKIHAEACQQPQILEASHVLVFAAWKNVTPAQIDTYMQHIASERGMDIAHLEGFKNSIIGYTQNKPQAENFTWAAKQCYIGLGFGMVAAAHLGVDATPMEGFNPAALDTVLGLDAMGLGSVLVLPLGHRDVQNDILVNAKKVRRNKEDLFISLN